MNDKKLKLEQKRTNIIQKLINAAIDFVDEARDIEERIKEINDFENLPTQKIPESVEKKNEKKI